MAACLVTDAAVAVEVIAAVAMDVIGTISFLDQNVSKHCSNFSALHIRRHLKISNFTVSLFANQNVNQ